MPEQHLEAEPAQQRDPQRLEEMLARLWDKARTVSDSLLQLREANRTLTNRASELEARTVELESTERQLRADLGQREMELQRIRKEFLQLQSNGTEFFTKEEKEALRNKIADLIKRIDSRL